uniref:ABC transporter substrate-binding protein n=1 Tax=Polynucleobacter sp. TaxID=2029855 RepID=UPI0040476A3B
MNSFRPFDPDRPLFSSHCSCGKHASAEEHAQDMLAKKDEEKHSADFIEASLVKALFPQESRRRAFLKAVGAGGAMSALSGFLPVGALQAMAQDKSPLEKTDLKIGFIPITCATPLIMADPMGFYKKQGLNVTLTKTAGWALMRDKMLNKEYDATHFLSPMPISMSMGLGSAPAQMRVATIQNINGQAITLANKHKDKRDPKMWKGMKFAVPFEYSMHNFLLRYYVAQAGLDPDRDIQIRVTPPPEMVANLRAGNLDGYLGPDPFNQRAVYDEIGFIHILTKDIWNGHPCCAFGTSEEWIAQNPNTFAALYRAVLNASTMASDAANRPMIAKAISTPNYLNQPETVVMQVLTGKFADGLGNVQNVPDRIDFNPIPWYSMATWMLTQMQRWGYVKGGVNYKDISEKIFLLTDAKKYMGETGIAIPEKAKSGYEKVKIMGKEFDPSQPAAYLKSFPISSKA